MKLLAEKRENKFLDVAQLWHIFCDSESSLTHENGCDTCVYSVLQLSFFLKKVSAGSNYQKGKT